MSCLSCRFLARHPRWPHWLQTPLALSGRMARPQLHVRGSLMGRPRWLLQHGPPLRTPRPQTVPYMST